MAEKDIAFDHSDEESSSNGYAPNIPKPKWYRSTFYNAFILGMCNFLAPGIWGAMNSLGAGGEERPYLVNAANALTFGLMVITCYFGSALVRVVGIKWTMIIGTMGYAPYAAGLYCNNKFGNTWFVILGAALCGATAGVFWMAEAAIALSYPEPENQGRFLGFWISFRLGGQILGGAINLGLNATANMAGAVSPNVYLAFIALQALGPFVGLLLNKPEKVERTDGIPVVISMDKSVRREIVETTKLFITPGFLILIPLIAQAVYTEAVMFTFSSLYFSVRGRALGSFLSGIVAITAGNLLGLWLDKKSTSLKTRARVAMFVVLGVQGICWIWATALVSIYHNNQPTFDWSDAGFGYTFSLLLIWIGNFQPNYMFLYFVIGNLAKSDGEVVRYAALLRGTESAVQAVSYGLNALPTMASYGGVYLNFGLWLIALWPSWLVVSKIGTGIGDRKVEREHRREGVIEEVVAAPDPTPEHLKIR